MYFWYFRFIRLKAHQEESESLSEIGMWKILLVYYFSDFTLECPFWFIVLFFCVCDAKKKVVAHFIVITGGNQNSILPWFYVRAFPLDENQIKTTSNRLNAPHWRNNIKVLKHQQQSKFISNENATWFQHLFQGNQSKCINIQST